MEEDEKKTGLLSGLKDSLKEGLSEITGAAEIKTDNKVKLTTGTLVGIGALIVLTGLVIVAVKS